MPYSGHNGISGFDFMTAKWKREKKEKNTATWEFVGHGYSEVYLP